MKLVVSNGRDLRVCDVSGSANRVNKADLGLIIHRDPDRDSTRTDVQIRKVRFKEVGKIGGGALRWDVATGRYVEITPQGAYTPRAYPE
jgi:hypothetical protein